MAKNKSFLKKIIYSIIVVLLLIGGLGAYWAYKTIYQPNVNVGEKKSKIIYIPTGSTFEDVVRILSENNILKDQASFEWLAQKKKYKNAIKSGKYRILAKMNNNELVNILRAGLQEPVVLNFNGLKTKYQLITRFAKRIEADSLDLIRAFDDNGYLSKYGFNEENIQALFIPDTYEFYWNTSVDQFFEKMAIEYKKFWTDERKQKANTMNLSQTEVAVLASIVQGEQCCDNEEKKVIAGLYLNRIKNGMKLESDPTVIYAIGDFSVQRVYNGQLKFDSPYNTYVIEGLPPGPIGFASKSSMDAVLNYNKNNYLFMCAKPDLSGKHNFAKTYEQHKIYAQLYRKALIEKGIH